MIRARVGTHTWQRLAPIADPAPLSTPRTQDGSAHQTQALILTDTEAADRLTATAAGEI
ncbi:hypothetical protein [Streptomyces sp. MBT62]|uniref:hypothetical protein n=1 Tax=Streptomyces sp. MBT62 TaxID=2800410 RepID=UPI00190A69F4|nr:hypothetical protein [Streptomyces sp. MBT62]MBK3571676.1 hypothetical protein [Streptomyces sp. MBT62]